MPVSKSNLFSASILLGTMLVAHSTSTASVQSINDTTSHRLITIPKALIIAWSYSVSKLHLTIHSRSKWISILFASSRQITWTNEDWFLVLVDNASPMTLVGVGALRIEVLNYWSIFRNLIFADKAFVLGVLLRCNVFEHIFS